MTNIFYVVLLTTAAWLLAFNSAMREKDKSNSDKAATALVQLEQLRDRKSISYAEYREIRQQLAPIRYSFDKPWLQRHTIPVVTGCLLAQIAISNL